MSSTPPPRSPGPSGANSTRQLLDELDALMQRMLALPVNQLDEGPASPEAAATDPPGPATLTARQAPPPEPPAEAPALPPVRPPSGTEALGARKVIAHPAAPYPATPHKNEAAYPPPPYRPEPAPTPAPAEPPSRSTAPPAFSTLPPLSRTAVPRPSAPAVRKAAWHARARDWAGRAVVWSNRAFDRCTDRLGAAGRWLRSPRGRATLGWVGLGLWAVALALGLLRLIG